jgi:hypothetical protein
MFLIVRLLSTVVDTRRRWTLVVCTDIESVLDVHDFREVFPRTQWVFSVCVACVAHVIYCAQCSRTVGLPHPLCHPRVLTHVR